MKYFLRCFLLLTLLNSCGNETKERSITIVNRSNTELTNVSIKSSRMHKHLSGIQRLFSKNHPRMNDILIDHLADGEEFEMIYLGDFNRSCISLNSETLNLQIMDCMEEKFIKSNTFKIIIDQDDLTIEL